LPGIAASAKVASNAAPGASQYPTNQYKLKGTLLMLMTIAIILVVLWLLGLVTSTTMGGLIHILLVVAIIVILVKVIQGRKVL